MNPPDISNVPSEFVKWFVIMLVFVAMIAIGVVVFIRSGRKQTSQIEPSPLKVKVEPKRFNKDFCDARHEEISRRLNGHDAEINTLWTTLRAEDEATRQEIRRMNASISRSLGRIEGKLGIVPHDLPES
jgi:signal transduction histidine kinase